jgi:hypothetical protein
METSSIVQCAGQGDGEAFEREVEPTCERPPGGLVLKSLLIGHHDALHVLVE